MANRQQQFRKLLRDYPEGLTAQQIAEATDDNLKATCIRLKKMVDVYVVGWVIVLGRPRALWAVATIPEDCPRPAKQDRVLKGYLR